jgi:photosystem II protein
MEDLGIDRSIYIMKSPEAWDRFIRFMERYGETNGLAFTKLIK